MGITGTHGYKEAHMGIDGYKGVYMGIGRYTSVYTLHLNTL